LKLGKPAWGEAELFQQSFARLFVTYRDLYLLNSVEQLAQQKGQPDARPLSDADFYTQNGQPPWEFVNSSLRAGGMDFMIDAPNRFSFNPYRPTLKKAGSSAEISFEGLSSGERVLMALAFAVYYASDARQTISRPKLLLLDEVDAPLHPSMCRSLLSTVQHVLVQEYGLKVIMTTHAPSTVALAPEEAIHVMRSGVPGILKVSKDAALRDLTDGVPILSVFYDGRRQVFVESPRDVEVYQAGYEALRRHVTSELSIIFIATGVESASGQHMNTGCDVVKRIVSELRNGGARHTLGLIDWDGQNKSTGGIIVLAEGERDGLESVLFDPLLLLNTLIRLSVQGMNVKLGLAETTTYMSPSTMDNNALQLAIDKVQSLILGRNRGASDEVEYIGRFKLLVDQDYIRMNDHDLEQKVDTAFPELRAISKNRVGELAKWIARTIIADRPEHAPMCLLNTFSHCCPVN
jgi:energy-coupling factor transporter ATP-binding protein EcfA2